jgi:hypothetical protein
MHENSFEGDEELGDDCAILKKMQTTIYEYGLHHFLIKVGEFSSFNHISFFQYFYLFIYLGCGAPSKTVEEWGLFNFIFLVGL